MDITTKTGDDGTTGLLYGGRVRKDSVLPTAYGEVDEAQSFLGVSRSQCRRGRELATMLIAIERDLWGLMAGLATLPENRHKLTPGKSSVTAEMVDGLEVIGDRISARFEMPSEFVVPGEEPVAAALDVARAVVRRAERASLAAAASGSHVVAYLNRLSDLLWTLARWQEGESLTAREK